MTDSVCHDDGMKVIRHSKSLYLCQESGFSVSKRVCLSVRKIKVVNADYYYQEQLINYELIFLKFPHPPLEGHQLKSV